MYLVWPRPSWYEHLELDSAKMADQLSVGQSQTNLTNSTTQRTGVGNNSEDAFNMSILVAIVALTWVVLSCISLLIYCYNSCHLLKPAAPDGENSSDRRQDKDEEEQTVVLMV